MYNVYHVAEKLWTTILFLKKKRQIRHALHLWKYIEWLFWELGQSLFTCEIWFPVSLLIYIQFHYRKKVLKYFPFLEAIMETTQDWIVHNFTNSVNSNFKICLLLKCSTLNMCQNLLHSNYAEIFMTQNVLKCSD